MFRVILITLLLICSTFVTAKQTLIYNVKGYTYLISGQLHTFNALVFADGKVVKTGNDIKPHSRYDKIIDGKGKVLLPGLIDGHGHYIGLGTNLLSVDVRDLPSAVSTAKHVAKYAKTNPSLSWIKGRGWNQELWPNKQFPTARILDEYIADRPVVLKRVDGHAMWLNSKALQLAGINRHSVAPEGGEIVKNKQGEPTGVLIDTAMELINREIPEPTAQDELAAFNKATAHLLSLGITSVHDAGVSDSRLKLFKQLQQQDKLKVRIYPMVSAGDPHLLDWLNAGQYVDNKDMLTIRSVKIYGDGALGSRGAALLAPYEDDKHNHGLLVTQPDQLTTLFDDIAKAHFQINIHAIGDRANRIALDNFEKMYKTYPDAIHNRNRVEHAQVVSLDDIPRYKSLEVLPSMQPTHATSDMNMAENRIGKERLKGAYAWQTFLKQGSKVVAGSDFPVELANPFYGLHAAVTRQDRTNQPNKGWIPEEALSVKQAFKAFTIDAAYGAHQEAIVGGLEPGKWADFILVDQDIFNIDNKDIWRTKVLQTWVAGKKLY